MAKASLIIKNKPAPYQISVKAITGDTISERFISFTNGILRFAQTTGVASYLVTVLSSDGKSHTTTINLDCSPILSPCGSGPSLTLIKNPLKGSVTFVHQSTAVSVISWEVYLGEIKVLSGTLANDFAELTIHFAQNLVDGNYTLKIKGFSCSSGVSSLPFTVNDAEVPQNFSDTYPQTVITPAKAFLVSLVKGGDWLTKIDNVSTGLEVYNTTLTYVAGQPNTINTPSFADGYYGVTVNGIRKEVYMGAALAACQYGPLMRPFVSIAKNALGIQFDALNVTPLRTRIRQGSTIIQDKTITPVNAHPIVTVDPPLANGTYTFGVKGVACSSDWSELDFTIAGVTLVVNNVAVDVIDGKYRLTVTYSGGTAPFTFAVTSTAGVLAGSGQTTSPIVIIMPAGTSPQTVLLDIIDSGGSSVRNISVVLPSLSGAVSPCGVFVNASNKVISYAGGSLVDRITGISLVGSALDMANTANKIFVIDRVATGTPRHIIKEYAITLSPFTQTFTRDYTINDPAGASGLCAASDTKLFMCGMAVQKIEMAGSLAVATTMFFLPDSSYCTGDLMYDPVSRLFAITYENGSYTKIGIFTEAGTLLRSAAIPANIYGLYQADGNSYMVRSDGVIYKIDILTLIYSQVGTLGTPIVGASQSPECISIPSGASNTVQNRRISMNTTGYGFDNQAADGIHPDWVPRIEKFRNMSYNGVSFSGITDVRLCMKWCDYEVTDGVYQDTKLIAAVNWLKARGLKVSICFWALRKVGDGFFDNANRAKGSGGTYYVEESDKYTFAPSSSIGRTKLKTVCKHLAQTCATFGSDFDYISLGYGNTEEFYMSIIKTYNPPRNTELTGYSDVDGTAWATYIADKGYPGTAMPVSTDANDAYATGDMFNTTIGKLFYHFRTDQLALVHAAFRDGVREGGVKVCGFVADVARAQSAWYGMYEFNKVFAGCDYMYMTEGGNRDGWLDKTYGVDALAGTFPSAKYMAEGDPEDLSSNYTTNYGNPVDPELLKKYLSNLFERGLYTFHFAMAFSDGSGGYPDNISPLAPALYYIKTNYLDQTNIASIPSITVSYNISSFKGDVLKGTWDANGGGLAKQVKILVTS